MIEPVKLMGIIDGEKQQLEDFISIFCKYNGDPCILFFVIGDLLLSDGLV